MKNGNLTDKERKIMDTAYEEGLAMLKQWRKDNMCPHTTNPLQLKRLCKRCRKELEITSCEVKTR